MKSILISIKPKWCEKIASGEKTIEVRKSAPKEVPFKAYIYATRPKKYYKCGAVSTSDELLWLANGKVEMGDGFKFWADGDEYQRLNGRIIGEFICDKIEKIVFAGNKYLIADKDEAYTNNVANESCLDFDDLANYLGNKGGYALHISDLKIYDKPKELSEFSKVCPYYDDCENCKYKSENCKEWREIKRPPESWGYIR